MSQAHFVAATRVFCPSSSCSTSRSVEHSSSPASLLPLATTNSNTPPPVHAEKENFSSPYFSLIYNPGHGLVTAEESSRGVGPTFSAAFSELRASAAVLIHDNMTDWKDTEYVYDFPRASLCGPVSSAFRAKTRGWRRRSRVVVLGGLTRLAFLCNKRTCAQLPTRNHRPGAFLITVLPLLQPLFERFHSLIVSSSPSPTAYPSSPSASHSACFLRPD